MQRSLGAGWETFALRHNRVNNSSIESPGVPLVSCRVGATPLGFTKSTIDSENESGRVGARVSESRDARDIRNSKLGFYTAEGRKS